MRLPVGQVEIRRRTEVKKRIVLLIVLVVVVAFGSLMFAACNEKNDNGDETPSPVPEAVKPVFGRFDYNGKWLYSFKNIDITFDEAITLVRDSMSGAFASESADSSAESETIISSSEVSEDVVNYYLSQYASLTVTSTFYNEGANGETVEEKTTVEIRGEDLKHALTVNEISLSTGIVIRDILCTPEGLAYYEQKNVEFHEDPDHYVAPFNDIYTYHKSNAQFVLQTHTYVAISSSQVGGMSACYIQENETIFDLERKAQNFQSSLGMSIQTKNGTKNEGIIFTVQFVWNEK